MDNKELYRQAKNKFGVTAQLDVAIEELAELTKEICKIKRGLGTIGNLAEEIADVEIMCEQLRFLFAVDSVVDTWKKTKLNRLAHRVK